MRIVSIAQSEVPWRDMTQDSHFASHCHLITFYSQELLLITEG